MQRTTRVHRVPMRHPGDISAIVDLITRGELEPKKVIAVLGKTEGNGCVNDFTRAYAVSTLEAFFAEQLSTTKEEIAQRIAMVMSGGTEGGLSPHFLVFSVSEGESTDTPHKALAVASAFTREFKPEEIGRSAQVEVTAQAVKDAMRAAGIDSPDDVHYVQVKCPLLTSERVADAHARGNTVVSEDTYASMGYSRGASALGIAIALGEVAPSAVTDAKIGDDFSLWSSRASTSAGVELTRNEIVVMGNSEAWAGDLVIGHSVMQDPIDFPAVTGALRAAGIEAAGQLNESERDRVIAVLAKAEPPRSGLIRGRRHIMLDDSDIQATRHARALVGGVVAAAVGSTDLFISGGAEHQGPDGGGPIAIIASRG